MGNKNILVVDDDPHIRNACAESLKGINRQSHYNDC